MSRDHRDLETFAFLRNIIDLGLSTIIAVGLPLVILGYIISIGLIVLPLGFGLPAGIACGSVHTVSILTALIILAVPRLLMKYRESRLRKEIESLPEEERKKREDRETVIVLIAMGHTPRNRDGSAAMFDSEGVVRENTEAIELSYRDFTRPMGWAYYKGTGDVITTDKRHIIIPADKEWDSISLFNNVTDGGRPIFVESIRSGSGGSRLGYTNRSGRRILSKITPNVRLKSTPDRGSGEISMDLLVDLMSKRTDIMEEGRKQRELLSVWIR
ncbi:MAG: hypothetical protein ACMUIG_07485 [Thermoplasmatota archaeon]